MSNRYFPCTPERSGKPADKMTLVEVAYQYRRAPDEYAMRALKELREVYGIWRVSFDEAQRLVKVEYDASRLQEDDIAALLRNAGFELAGKADESWPRPEAA